MTEEDYYIRITCEMFISCHTTLKAKIEITSNAYLQTYQSVENTK